jgi:hypothetical protein
MTHSIGPRGAPHNFSIFSLLISTLIQFLLFWAIFLFPSFVVFFFLIVVFHFIF